MATCKADKEGNRLCTYNSRNGPVPVPTPHEHSIAAGVASATFLVLVAIVVQRRRQLSKKKLKDEAGMIDLSQEVSVDDIMQKMPMDIVVEVAKEGRKQEITFHTWDFGGQEVYYVLHHLFITVRIVHF